MKKILASMIAASFLLGAGMTAPKTKLPKCCLKKQACCKKTPKAKCCPKTEGKVKK